MNNTFRQLDYQKLSAAAILMAVVVVASSPYCLSRKMCLERMWKDEQTAHQTARTAPADSCRAADRAGRRRCAGISGADSADNLQLLLSQSEIAANYGQVFSSVTDRTTYVSEHVTLKFIPDLISFSQYSTVLIRSPNIF
jgi:hypothetical protein